MRSSRAQGDSARRGEKQADAAETGLLRDESARMHSRGVSGLHSARSGPPRILRTRLSLARHCGKLGRNSGQDQCGAQTGGDAAQRSTAALSAPFRRCCEKRIEILLRCHCEKHSSKRPCSALSEYSLSLLCGSHCRMAFRLLRGDDPIWKGQHERTKKVRHRALAPLPSAVCVPSA